MASHERARNERGEGYVIIVFISTVVAVTTGLLLIVGLHLWEFNYHDVGIAPCSELTWAFDDSGAPPDTDGVHEDIAGALDRISSVTGLTFREVDPNDSPWIMYRWVGVDHFDNSIAGAQFVPREHVVELNWDSVWNRGPFAGFGVPYGMGSAAARGWLYTHETLHALGLGHSEEELSIMAPLSVGQHRFTALDMAMLMEHYPQVNCPNRRFPINP